MTIFPNFEYIIQYSIAHSALISIEAIIIIKKAEIMSIERRKDTRISLSKKITVTMNDVILNGTECKNVSKSGMCIAIDDRIDGWKSGLLIMVHKFNKDVILFTSKFEVQWKSVSGAKHEKTLIGVNFKDLDHKNTDHLSQIIHYQSNLAS